MSDPQGVATKQKRYAPRTLVPSTGAYIAYFVGGGGEGRSLKKGDKFPSKVRSHAVSYWTRDRRMHPTDSNLDPGDRAPKAGVYRAYLRGGGTKDKRFAERERLLPTSFNGKDVLRWKLTK